MKKTFTILAVIFSLISCNRNSIQRDITGIWISPFQFFFNPDTIRNANPIYYPSFPYLIDFTEQTDLVLKIFGDTTYYFTYSIRKDSVLMIDDYKLKINSINGDSLLLTFDGDTAWLFRVKKSLRYDSLEVFDILTSKIWSDTNLHPHNNPSLGFEDQIEYLPYNAKIKKYLNTGIDTVDGFKYNIEFWGWTLEKYKDYYFIFDGPLPIWEGFPYELFNYITDITDSTLCLFTPNYVSEKSSKYFGFESHVDFQVSEKMLQGIWLSQNERNKSYGQYLSNKLVDKGVIGLYNGPIWYDFSNHSLSQYGLQTDTLHSEWFLNKDASVLFYRYKFVYDYDSIPEVDNQIEIALLRSLTDQELVLSLYDNWFPSLGKYKDGYRLNIVQKFVKQE